MPPPPGSRGESARIAALAGRAAAGPGAPRGRSRSVTAPWPRGPVRTAFGGYAEGPERPAEQGGRREGGSRFVYGPFGAGQSWAGVR